MLRTCKMETTNNYNNVSTNITINENMEFNSLRRTFIVCEPADNTKNFPRATTWVTKPYDIIMSI